MSNSVKSSVDMEAVTVRDCILYPERITVDRDMISLLKCLNRASSSRYVGLTLVWYVQLHRMYLSIQIIFSLIPRQEMRYIRKLSGKFCSFHGFCSVLKSFTSQKICIHVPTFTHSIVYGAVQLCTLLANTGSPVAMQVHYHWCKL